jgi:hypothetical protein
MKKINLLIIFIFNAILSVAQTAKEYKVGPTGCTVKAPCSLAVFNVEEIEPFADEEDSLKEKDVEKLVNADAKCSSGGITYGVLYKDHGPQEFGEGYTIEDHLKTSIAGDREVFSCKLTFITGIKRSADGKLLSVTDEWEDYDGNWYQVKGYTDGRVVALLYVKKKGKFAVNPAMKAFLDSFTFPKKQ